MYFRPKASVLAAVSSLTFWLLNLEEAEELFDEEDGVIDWIYLLIVKSGRTTKFLVN